MYQSQIKAGASIRKVNDRLYKWSRSHDQDSHHAHIWLKSFKEIFFSRTRSLMIWNTLRERLRTHKVFKKDQCFYLNYHKFSIKSYGELLKITHFYHFDPNPRFPPFLLYVRWKSRVTFVRRCFRDVSMGHQGLKVYKVCINYDPWLTMANSTAMSDLAKFDYCARPRYQVSVYRNISTLVMYLSSRYPKKYLR